MACFFSFLNWTQGSTKAPDSSLSLRERAGVRMTMTGKASLHFRQRGLIHIRFHQRVGFLLRRLHRRLRRHFGIIDHRRQLVLHRLTHRHGLPGGVPRMGVLQLLKGDRRPRILLQIGLHLRRIV